MTEETKISGSPASGGTDKKETPDAGLKEKKEWSQRRHNHCGCGHCGCHRHNSGGVFGLAVLIAGVALLLNTFGFLSWQFWDYVWPFWPMFLILIGLRIILGRNWGADGLVFLIGLALFSFVVVYALIQIDSPWISSFSPRVIDFVENFKPLNQ